MVRRNREIGNTTKAIEHYEKFLDLWRDANPGTTEVEDAMKRVAAMHLWRAVYG